MGIDHIPYNKRKDIEITTLVGLTFTAVEINADRDAIEFKTSDGRTFIMYHEQDCCEGVSIESVVGDLGDLVGEPLLIAEEVTNSDENPKDVEPKEYQESFTWTFYKFATRKGYVDIRWYGESNGYYSERVDFVEVLQ